jgi:hypothetical protein
MSWLSNFPSNISVTSKYSLLGSLARLVIVMAALVLTSCVDSRARPLDDTTARILNSLEPGCTDPKTCGEPSLEPGCTDPKTCGEPNLEPGCTDPKTCGEPNLEPGCTDPKTCGEPSLEPGCTDPKTCGEPRSH